MTCPDLLLAMMMMERLGIPQLQSLPLSSYGPHQHICVCAVLCFVAQSCPTLCDPVDCSLSGSSVHGDSPGKNTGVGCHALLQRIFPTQGSNSGLPHYRQILYHLNHQGSPSFSKLKICLSDSPDNLKKLFFSHSLFPCVF